MSCHMTLDLIDWKDKLTFRTLNSLIVIDFAKVNFILSFSIELRKHFVINFVTIITQIILFRILFFYTFIVFYFF